MQVPRDNEKETSTFSQAHCTKSTLEMYGTGERKPAQTIEVGPQLPIYQGGEKLLIKSDTQRHQLTVAPSCD